MQIDFIYRSIRKFRWGWWLKYHRVRIGIDFWKRTAQGFFPMNPPLWSCRRIIHPSWNTPIGRDEFRFGREELQECPLVGIHNDSVSQWEDRSFQSCQCFFLTRISSNILLFCGWLFAFHLVCEPIISWEYVKELSKLAVEC